MLKKALVVAVLAGSSILFAGTSAQAVVDPYPEMNPTSALVSGDATTPVGEPQSLPFEGFTAFEPTTATSDAAVTLGALKTVVSLGKTANGSGAVTYTASATIPGTYVITVTGVNPGTVATATLIVLPADAASALPNTGFNSPLLAIWASAGVLIFGIAMVIVRTTVRRKRATV
jgi:hypothetical protein